MKINAKIIKIILIILAVFACIAALWISIKWSINLYKTLNKEPILIAEVQKIWK